MMGVVLPFNGKKPASRKKPELKVVDSPGTLAQALAELVACPAKVDAPGEWLYWECVCGSQTFHVTAGWFECSACKLRTDLDEFMKALPDGE